jgi:hypothetical protein
VRLDADEILAKGTPNIAWKGGNGASQRRKVYPVQTVHLNIAWLPSDSKIYLAKRAAAKAQRK